MKGCHYQVYGCSNIKIRYRSIFMEIFVLQKYSEVLGHLLMLVVYSWRFVDGCNYFPGFLDDFHSLPKAFG